MLRAIIAGTGSFLPPRIITNAELETMVDTSDEWIVSRTGVHERHVADAMVFTSDLAIEAARNAIENASMSPEDIELIVVATLTADMHTPSVACIVQSALGFSKNTMAFDINAACSGFIYAITIANQFLQNGVYKTALVIGAETLSKVTDWEDRNTCVLFGDGAGAVVLKAAETEDGILLTSAGCDGIAGLKSLTIPGLKVSDEEAKKRENRNLCTIRMDGGEVFKYAVRMMSEQITTIIEKAGLKLEDVKLIIPHQANARILEAIAHRIHVDKSVIFFNVSHSGNTSAASVPLALQAAVQADRIHKDDYIVLVGLGGGLTWGAVLIKWA